MQVGFDDQQSGHLCALDNLHRVKNTYIAEIAGECYVRSYVPRGAVAIDRKVRPACAADSFQSRRDRNARDKELGFLQAVVGEVEFLAADVKADERKALSRGLIQIFLLDADITELFPQGDGPRAALERIVKQLECLFR